MTPLPPPLHGLTAFNQWLNYRLTPQPGGKMKKEAVGRGGYRVDPTDPAEWMSYEQAATLPVALNTMHNAVVTAGALQPGQTVLVMEAMKMQHTIAAPTDGVVASINVKPGSQVGAGDVLAVVEGDSDSAEGAEA